MASTLESPSRVSSPWWKWITSGQAWETHWQPEIHKRKFAYHGNSGASPNAEISERPEQSERKRPLVFLDSNVILACLLGDPSAEELFLAEASGRIYFAVNSIVLQELLLTADLSRHPEFERIREHLQILPVDFSKAEALIPMVQRLRNRMVHSNDILILSSADGCDFLVTKDRLLMSMGGNEKPKIVTPEELARHLRAA